MSDRDIVAWLSKNRYKQTKSTNKYRRLRTSYVYLKLHMMMLKAC